MTVHRYSTNKDRTAQQSTGGGGLFINRRCDEPRCKRPISKGETYHGLRYCLACYAVKAQKVAA